MRRLTNTVDSERTSEFRSVEKKYGFLAAVVYPSKEYPSGRMVRSQRVATENTYVAMMGITMYRIKKVIMRI